MPICAKTAIKRLSSNLNRKRFFHVTINLDHSVFQENDNWIFWDTIVVNLLRYYPSSIKSNFCHKMFIENSTRVIIRSCQNRKNHTFIDSTCLKMYPWKSLTIWDQLHIHLCWKTCTLALIRKYCTHVDIKAMNLHAAFITCRIYWMQWLQSDVPSVVPISTWQLFNDIVKWK